MAVDASGFASSHISEDLRADEVPAKKGNKCLGCLKDNYFTLATLAGVCVGFAIAFGIRTTKPSAVALTWISMPGEIYLRLLQMTILPLIASNILLVLYLSLYLTIILSPFLSICLSLPLSFSVSPFFFYPLPPSLPPSLSLSLAFYLAPYLFLSFFLSPWLSLSLFLFLKKQILINCQKEYILSDILIAALEPKKNGRISIIGVSYVVLINLLGAAIGTTCASIIKPGSRQLVTPPPSSSGDSALTGTGLTVSDVFLDMF
ncbi:unnamed protein product [Schistocephalus solidus]|uniref:Amino acid transporter n=1 Tax=Schistocephalus solidus TaxID=70667 RepID=A0A183SSA0_SCHSO|nr:unnamed protein product [Schistocephalus solidus]